jgi:hypothetical protein
MNVTKIEEHLSTLNEDELLVLVGELVLSEGQALGGKPPSDDEKRLAAKRFASETSKAVSKALKHPVSTAVLTPGPVATFVDYLAGMALQELGTEPKLVAYAALAARYGLLKLIDKYGPKSEVD